MLVLGIDPGWANAVGWAVVSDSDAVVDSGTIIIPRASEKITDCSQIVRASVIKDGLITIFNEWWNEVKIIGIEDHSSFIGAKFKRIGWAGRQTSQSALLSSAYFQSVFWICLAECEERFNRNMVIKRISPLSARSKYLGGLDISESITEKAVKRCAALKIREDQIDDKAAVMAAVYARTGIWPATADIADAIVVASAVAGNMMAALKSEADKSS